MVRKVKVNSSVELFDNRNDETRVYDVAANVHITGAQVGSMDNGNVYKDGVHVAQFNTWSENHLNVTYMGVDQDAQNTINDSVNTFMSEVKEFVGNK